MNLIRIAFCFFCLSSFAQKEAAQWHFGSYGGLNFQNGAPTAITNSTMNARFSSTGISDNLGNLLFYSDGQDVWNKNNVLMANGQNTGGNSQGYQASVVIKKSGNVYYLITYNITNFISGLPMINYSLVDMSLAAGLGSVTASNLSITPAGFPMANKLAATRHCNQTDHWILTHKGGFPGSNEYHAFLATAAGISSNVVISSIGANQPQSYGTIYYGANYYYQGIQKFSPNGKKICATMPFRAVELYDFNTATGSLSNLVILDTMISITPSIGGVYSEYDPNSMCAEFSPDGSKLYVTYTNNQPSLVQFDLCAGSPNAIAASKTAISLINRGGFYPNGIPTMQLGIDGKIYVTLLNTGNTNTPNFMGVINNPNVTGTLCNYVPNAVPLSTISPFPPNTFYPSSQSCLPQFISNYFEQKPVLPALTGTINCGSAAFTSPTLCAGAGYSVVGYQWSFNDVLSGASNTSTLVNPTHVFSANGTYNVKLILQYHPCGADTLKKNVIITGLPSVSVTGKTAICKGQSATLALSGANSFSVNGVAQTQSSLVVQPTVTTVYTLTGSDTQTGCRSLRTFTVTVSPCTGINEVSVNPNDDILIYPNPNSGYFYVELKDAAELWVTDVSGRTILQKELASGKNELNMSEQKAGLYFISIKTPNVFHQFKLIRD